jgi:hypothetical protein
MNFNRTRPGNDVYLVSKMDDGSRYGKSRSVAKNSMMIRNQRNANTTMKNTNHMSPYMNTIDTLKEENSLLHHKSGKLPFRVGSATGNQVTRSGK